MKLKLMKFVVFLFQFLLLYIFPLQVLETGDIFRISVPHITSYDLGKFRYLVYHLIENVLSVYEK